MFHQCLLTSFPPTIKQHCLEAVFFLDQSTGTHLSVIAVVAPSFANGTDNKAFGTAGAGAQRPKRNPTWSLKAQGLTHVLTKLMTNQSVFYNIFIHLPLYNATDKCTSRLQCWVNLEKLFDTCFKNLDMLDWLIGCFDSWQQLHHGTLPIASSWAPLCALMTSTACTPGPGATATKPHYLQVVFSEPTNDINVYPLTSFWQNEWTPQKTVDWIGPTSGNSFWKPVPQCKVLGLRIQGYPTCEWLTDQWWASSNKISDRCFKTKKSYTKKLRGFKVLSSSRPFPLVELTLFVFTPFFIFQAKPAPLESKPTNQWHLSVPRPAQHSLLPYVVRWSRWRL